MKNIRSAPDRLIPETRKAVMPERNIVVTARRELRSFQISVFQFFRISVIKASMSSPLRFVILGLTTLLTMVSVHAGTPRAEHVFIISFDQGGNDSIAK